MSKRGHIKFANSASCGDKLGNSSLTQSLRELEKSSLDGLKSYLRADFPAQPTNLAQDTRIANALKKFASCKNAESTLDSANSQNLIKNQVKKSSSKFLLRFAFAKSRVPLNFIDSNLPNKADSQNLTLDSAIFSVKDYRL